MSISISQATHVTRLAGPGPGEATPDIDHVKEKLLATRLACVELANERKSVTLRTVSGLYGN
jgi:hypothetical protein